jgi:hypothetical protein
MMENQPIRKEVATPKASLNSFSKEGSRQNHELQGVISEGGKDLFLRIAKAKIAHQEKVSLRSEIDLGLRLVSDSLAHSFKTISQEEVINTINGLTFKIQGKIMALELHTLYGQRLEEGISKRRPFTKIEERILCDEFRSVFTNLQEVRRLGPGYEESLLKSLREIWRKHRGCGSALDLSRLLESIRQKLEGEMLHSFALIVRRHLFETLVDSESRRIRASVNKMFGLQTLLSRDPLHQLLYSVDEKSKFFKTGLTNTKGPVIEDKGGILRKKICSEFNRLEEEVEKTLKIYRVFNVYFAELLKEPSKTEAVNKVIAKIDRRLLNPFLDRRKDRLVRYIMKEAARLSRIQ